MEITRLLIKLNKLNLGLDFKYTMKDDFEANDKVYYFENEWLELGIQFINNEPKQYVVYPNTTTKRFKPRDYEDLQNGVSIYLVKDISNYLLEVIENFEKQLKIIEKVLVDEMKLTRHYDLTDRIYLGID